MHIALLGSKGTTLDLLYHLSKSGKVPIQTVITLGEEMATKNKVAFYRGKEIMAFCEEQQIDCHVTKGYTLRKEEDQALFEDLKIDLLLVIGWERLLPDSVLGTLGKFACGMHGSAYGLPKGRGRSPLNWSILTGHRKFITYLFRYDAGMDSGDVIGFRAFDINEFDTIGSLHMKNRIVMQQLVEAYVPLIAKDKMRFQPQAPFPTTFYPKRTRLDGQIDWRESTDDIYALIRAVSFPYPSAYSKTPDGRELVIDEGFPFDSALYDSYVKSGTILDISISLNQFVVKTGNGSLIITRCSGVPMDELSLGMVLESADARAMRADIVTRYGDDITDDQKEIR